MSHLSLSSQELAELERRQSAIRNAAVARLLGPEVLLKALIPDAVKAERPDDELSKSAQAALADISQTAGTGVTLLRRRQVITKILDHHFGFSGIIDSRNRNGVETMTLEKKFDPAEPRGAHGRWVKGLRALADTMADETAKSRAAGSANSRYMTAGRDFRKAAKALEAGDHEQAATHLDAAITHIAKATHTSAEGTAAGEAGQRIQSEMRGGTHDLAAISHAQTGLVNGGTGTAHAAPAVTAPETHAVPEPAPAPAPASALKPAVEAPAAPQAPKPAKVPKKALIDPADLTVDKTMELTRHRYPAKQQLKYGVKPKAYQALVTNISDAKGKHMGQVQTDARRSGQMTVGDKVSAGNRNIDLDAGRKIFHAGGTAEEAHAANVEQAKRIIAGESNARKIRAALTAAGHPPVTHTSSKQVKGWATYHPGYEVNAGEKGVSVTHYGGSSISSKNEEARIKRTDEKIGKYSDVLTAKSIPHTVTRDAQGNRTGISIPHSTPAAEARAEERAAPGSEVEMQVSKPAGLQWRVQQHEEEYAGHATGGTQDIHSTTHNGHAITVDEPHTGEGWRYSIEDAKTGRELGYSGHPSQGGPAPHKVFQTADQAKTAAIAHSDRLMRAAAPGSEVSKPAEPRPSESAPAQPKPPGLSAAQAAERDALPAGQRAAYDAARAKDFTHDSAMWQARAGYRPGGVGVGQSLGHPATYTGKG